MKYFPKCNCGNNNYLFLFNKKQNKKNYYLFRCKKCNLVRTLPVPETTSSTINDLNNRLNKISLWKKFANKTLVKINQYMRTNNIKILDIGCNIGIFVKVAQERRIKAIGIDIDPLAVKIGKDKFNVDLRNQSLIGAHFKNNSFDSIVMSHTLEHIYEINKTLKEIRRILIPGGLLIIDVPNFDSIIINIQNFRRKFWYGYDFEHHIWHFTPHTLKRILEEEGFQILKIDTSENMYYEEINNIVLKFIRSFVLFSARIINSADQITVVAKYNK